MPEEGPMLKVPAPWPWAFIQGKTGYLGQLDDARGGPDVEGAGPLALGLQGVPDLAVSKGFSLHCKQGG